MKRLQTLLIVALMITVSVAFVLVGTADVAFAVGKKPAKVVMKSLSSTDYNTIKIIWKKTKNAKKYQVYRALSKNGKYRLIKTTTGTKFSNRGLTTGTKYFFKVRSVNGKYKGSFSSPKAAVPKLKKSTIKKIAASESTVTLSYKKINGAKRYQIYRATDKGGKYKQIGVTAKLSFSDKELKDDTTYFYKVRAVRSVNGKNKFGAYSSIKSIHTEKAEKLEGTESEINTLIKIVDYNIRYKDDGANRMIADRAPRLKKLIEKYQPDVIGLQEARPQWISYLEAELVGGTYSMYYHYRAKNNQEAQPILWNHNKYDLLDKGYYWLSDTPEVSSKGWGSKYYRGVTWAKLKVKETNQIFIFINTHLTGEETFAVNSADMICRRALEVGGFTEYGVLLTGDFNFTPNSIGYNAFTQNFVDINATLGFDSTYTLTNYNEWAEDDPKNRIVDYIMCSENYVTPLSYSVLNENIDNGWISDHRGLYVEALLDQKVK